MRETPSFFNLSMFGVRKDGLFQDTSFQPISSPSITMMWRPGLPDTVNENEYNEGVNFNNVTLIPLPESKKDIEIKDVLSSFIILDTEISCSVWFCADGE